VSERSNDPERDPALDDVAKLLDQAAELEARERAEAEALTSAPGLTDVERTLAGAWGETRGPRRGPFSLFAVLSLAAAALILVYVLKPAPDSGSRGPSGEYLSQGTDELRWTPGSTPGSHVIDWTGTSAATYRVTIRDAKDGRVVMPARTLSETSIEVSEAESARWPEQVVIEVEFRHANGAPGTLSASIAPGR
jgi:hypothetical protein